MAFLWPTYQESGVDGVVNNVQADINTLKDKINSSQVIDRVTEEFQLLKGKLESQFGKESPNQEPPEKPDLDQPAEQTFSIFNVEIGDPRSEVEQEAGEPQRSSLNEYGVNWAAYHNDYAHFFMVAYNENDQVAALFTNQDLLASKNAITFNSVRDDVRAALGEPEKSIRKGLVNYQVQHGDEFDMYKIDGNYVTLFYDVHSENTVTAIQIIDESLEQQKKDYYTEPSDALRKGFEEQLFDLTNAARVKHGKAPLKWGDPALPTARSHSTDMAENDYFSHTNLDGQSPFDRMREDNIQFRMAGENLAAGQVSSVFAHEGLMNSAGHRENILKGGYNTLAVGVAFNDKSQPYYTETFWQK
ncbi:CAP domain-containing protein [Lentibacillus sp. JNUCC-1]|uniref:CAP domain-containing protein n=1 Tax=Lentibacillus sp. JNUCC-1 TaxID=2654513 RepID=UPI001E4F449D|nr:CAP domain-containing protein [Lentibacillus sp. JNUCC-1]